MLPVSSIPKQNSHSLLPFLPMENGMIPFIFHTKKNNEILRKYNLSSLVGSERSHEYLNLLTNTECTVGTNNEIIKHTVITLIPSVAAILYDYSGSDRAVLNLCCKKQGNVLWEAICSFLPSATNRHDVIISLQK